ncbi:uncharacterized protein LOC116264191 [Nymphaea colorata]|uniref:uncharacterized protein LOC116264191 n=1 Tax=Nymphaea colorata TaxID=210225 RepID=UPI00129D98A6|nr:uncharacterized protein LOC116264191 [Nymphaea colorata]XP_031500134.1 uncharacterized protein LOC116264191 [Nymphaea colorata]
METINGDVGRSVNKPIAPTANEEDVLSSDKKLRSRSKGSMGKATDSSSSPSSSSSGSENEFQLEASKSENAVSQKPSHTSPPEHDQSEKALTSPLEKSSEGRRDDLGAQPGLTPEPMGDEQKKSIKDGVLDGLPMEPPPVQAMAQADDGDMYRIPSSVFARTKSHAPMEWSMASNESLFSIGGSSFSRDHVFLLEKSGELDMFTLNALQNCSIPTTPGSNNAGMMGLEEPKPVNVDANDTTRDGGKTQKQVTIAGEMHVADHGGEEENLPVSSAAPQSPSPRPSYCSSASAKSFTFPILTAEEKSGSVKVEPDPPQQPIPIEQTSWFSCIYCCPRCC